MIVNLLKLFFLNYIIGDFRPLLSICFFGWFHWRFRSKLELSRKKHKNNDKKLPKQMSEGVLQKCILTEFIKFTGKHQCMSFLFNKIADWRSATLLNKKLLNNCFPVSFAKFLRTPIYRNFYKRLLLKGQTCKFFLGFCGKIFPQSYPSKESSFWILHCCVPSYIQGVQGVQENFLKYVWQVNVCFYHATYVFWSESTLCSCLNVKELLAWNSREIWSLSDCNGIRTHNHLVRKLNVFVSPT